MLRKPFQAGIQHHRTSAIHSQSALKTTNSLIRSWVAPRPTSCKLHAMSALHPIFANAILPSPGAVQSNDYIAVFLLFFLLAILVVAGCFIWLASVHVRDRDRSRPRHHRLLPTDEFDDSSPHTALINMPHQWLAIQALPRKRWSMRSSCRISTSDRDGRARQHGTGTCSYRHASATGRS